MSHTTMQASRRPRASSASGGAPIGDGQRRPHRRAGISERRRGRQTKHAHDILVGQINDEAGLAVIESNLHGHWCLVRPHFLRASDGPLIPLWLPAPRNCCSVYPCPHPATWLSLLKVPILNMFVVP
jgi:hypothetical protein